MERRDFIKLSAIGGATAALDSCGQPDVELIRFIPEEELTPGVATWKPSICTLCPAGCGTLVKVMEGDAEVVRDGRRGLIKMGLAKKIEGNPNHPISQGKLCPRGQAMLQVTYHPDRIKTPLKRTGPRGSGQYQEITWDEAIETLVVQLRAFQESEQQFGRLVFLTRPLRGQREELIDRFLRNFRSPGSLVRFRPLDEATVCYANAYSFGYPWMPTYDLANARYVVAIGADFLGTWNSPVAQGFGFGRMRQGHPGRRGKLVMFEPRLSQTGANADEWISVKPGTEGLLALAFAHVILREKLRRPVEAERAGDLIAGWKQGLPDCRPEEVAKRTGVASDKIERIAREMAAHLPAMVIGGGAALAHTNALFAAFAINALNALLGKVGEPGGLSFTPQLLGGRFGWRDAPPSGEVGPIDILLVHPILEGWSFSAKVLLVYEANPVFNLPPGLRVREALEKIPFIASFGSFLDDTSVMADLVLPDHAPLESWLDHVPESGTTQGVVSLAPPAVRPLYNTRAMPDVLLEVAKRLGDDLEPLLRWKSYEELLRERVAALPEHSSPEMQNLSPDEFWAKIQEQGGWWSHRAPNPPIKEALRARIGKSARTSQPFWWRTTVLSVEEAGMAPPPLKFREPEFDGEETEYPFHFLPFESQAFGDGSVAHLPWLQEMPDPLSTAMWSTWVEINPDTALRLNIQRGDQVEVASQHGKLEAPALINPGIAPHVVAMPVGQGHTNFTRYASGRGANPISILAPMVVPETGSLAWAATRVKISKVGKGKLALFGAELREHPHEHR